MQARASRVHGISKEDFLKLTPYEWTLIEKDYSEEWCLNKEMNDRWTARIVCAIYQSSPKFKAVNKTEDDFMPSKGKGARRNETAENLYAKSVMIQNRLKAVQNHNKEVKNGG